MTEHFGISPQRIDIIAATMSNALGAAGGFVCGSFEVVEHQRLSGQAYVFSASMPAMLAVSSIAALEIMEKEGPKLSSALKENISVFRTNFLKNLVGGKLIGDEDSPILHLRTKTAFPKREEEEKILQEIVDYAMKDGVLCCRAKYCVGQELNTPRPSIRICLSAGLNKKDAEKAANLFKAGFKRFSK